MKTITYILLLSLLLLSCGPGSKSENASKPKQESLSKEDSIKKAWAKLDSARDVRRAYWRAKEIKDSLIMDSVLVDAYQKAAPKFKSASFEDEYELKPDDSTGIIYVELEIGNLFDDHQKYLLIRRQSSWKTCLDLYKITNSNTKQLLDIDEGGMPYIEHYIEDVNGDGEKDFVTHWYPHNGCCRRDMYDVYLYLPGKELFTPPYEFINATFSAKEKTIRGVEYGHPGEVPLYKYQWKGLDIDTIEFIYPDTSKKGQFIKTKKPIFFPTERDGIVLKVVPKEYHTIESYDWFINF